MSAAPTPFAELMRRFRAGDPDALAELYSQYGNAVRIAVRRKLHVKLRQYYDSIDFAQDVWASFAQQPPADLSFHSSKELLAYLHQMAHHKVIDIFRQRLGTQRYDITREEPIDTLADTGNELADRNISTPSQLAVATETWDELRKKLSPGQLAILEKLRDGYTHEEIAHLLKVSLSTVNRVVRRLKDLNGKQ